MEFTLRIWKTKADKDKGRELKMQIVYGLMGLAAIILVAAVHLYKLEGSSDEKMADAVKDTRDESRQAVATCKDLERRVTEVTLLYSQGLAKIQAEIDILRVRQGALDKKIIMRDRTLNLNVNDVTQRGKKNPLLRKAGIQ